MSNDLKFIADLLGDIFRDKPRSAGYQYFHK
jgi:hypothetical protein